MEAEAKPGKGFTRSAMQTGVSFPFRIVASGQ